MSLDLRSIAARLRPVRKRVRLALEAAALMRKAEPEPILLGDAGGSRVLANILPDRDTLARRLGAAPERFLPELGRALAGKAKARSTGKVYGEVEVPRRDWGRLPFLTYYKGDGGPYLTAGVWVVKDPVLGVNACYHRLMRTGPARGTVRVVENRGTDTALKRCGGKLDAAICVSAPMHVLFAAALSPAPDVSELDLAANLGPVRLARCQTVDLEIPEDCEMVIEGRFTGERGPEGPFVDITGTMDFVRRQPVFEVLRVACRRDPVHYTIVPGRSDHKTLMGIPKELDIFREAGRACRVLDVRITPGGCSWLHAVLKIDKRGPTDGRRALEAAFRAHKSLKHCVVVDRDVDIADPAEVEWALATRFQGDTDILLLKDQPASSLDPSARHVAGGKSRSAKLGLDATVKSGDLSLFRKVAG
ncbi:MAG: UbiD family decarboxylase [Elusimicrobia bacterium]|nr:UbiD family decarboxylase [Elusimicrobiota bacterium]